MTIMWEVTILGIELFDLFYNFFIYCFLGWVYESTYVSLKQRQWVNRGFLNGPVIPIYGCVATLLYLAFFNEDMISVTERGDIQSILIIFFAGLLLASLFEFVTSWLMEKLFHAKWWDYSNIPLNIQGRICLPVSIFWGFLSIVMAEFIQPRMTKLIDRIPRKAGEIGGIAILAIFLADLVSTVAATLQLDKKLSNMHRIREELLESLDRLKLYETREELKAKLAENPLYEYFGNKRSEYEQNVEKWLDKHKAYTEKREEERAHIKEEFREKMELFYAKYKEQKSNRFNRYVYKRIFKAFPHMRMNRREESFAALRERIRNDWKYRTDKNASSGQERNDDTNAKQK